MQNKENKSNKDILGMVKLALILFAITAVVALLLSTVNEMTKGPIAAQKEAAFNSAMSKVLPAESYDKLENISDYKLDETVREIYIANNANNQVGYCVKTAPRGFGGEISMIVGVDMDGKVTQVNVVGMTETPGLGTKAKDEKFLSQFTGKGDDVAVTTSTSPKGNEISAVTGATISSKAVTAGVQAALGAVNTIKGAGA